MRKGLFVAFEGIDYSGKDTQAAQILIWLSSLGYAFDNSNEPNDSEVRGSLLGHAIRLMLRGKMGKPEDLFEFQRMYVLDRGQDIFCLIKPVLDRGEIYVINRFGLSTIAYGMLLGEPPEKFIQLHKDVIGPSLIWPDITILLDISGEEAMRRLGKTSKEPEFFEKKEKLERIRQNYLSLVNHPEFKGSIMVVNGERNKEEVFENIQKIILPRLPHPELHFSK